MPSITGSETEKNLLKAFAGESQARNRYTYFAGIAEKEGYEEIADIFRQTADQERIHAKNFFKPLQGGMLEITASYPAGKLGTTLENLKAAAEGENEEWTKLYPEFADIAAKEGFSEIAALFKHVAIAEKHHEDRYKTLINNLENGRVFAKDGEVIWLCRKCGYLHKGQKALEKCPACQHPKAYFAVQQENY